MKRYRSQPNGINEHPEGMWVKYDDMTVEIARLLLARDTAAETIFTLSAHIERLRSDNAKLRAHIEKED
jgi:hypothetical protein